MSARLVSADFERFVARHFGARGRAWLDELPGQVERYRAAWRLQIEHFLSGGLTSCCLAVRTSGGQGLGEPWETLTRFDPIYTSFDATQAGMTGFHESPVWISSAVVGFVGAALAVTTALVARGWRLKA